MNRFTDRPLKQQFLLAGGMLAVLVVCGLTALGAQVVRQSRASRFVAVTYRLINQASILQRQVHLQSAAAWQGRREAAIEANRILRDGIQILKVSGIESLAQGDPLDVIEARYAKWWQILQPVLSDPQRASADDALIRSESESRAQLDRSLQQLIVSHNQAIEARRTDERHATQVTLAILILVVGILIVVLFILLRSLYQSIALPIAGLSVAAQKLESGDTATRVSVANRSEIGQLQKHFNRMAQNLGQQIEELKRLDDLKSEFLATVSHELRTPLTSILGYSKLIADGEAGAITAEQEEFLKIIQTNIDRLNQLINDLLDVERLERRELALRLNSVSIVDVVSRSVALMQIGAMQKGLKLQLTMAEGLPAIRGDESRLVQIFTNLISNSIKYTPSGSIKIDVFERVEQGHVVFQIADTGLGMNEKELSQLFQRFFRAESARKAPEGGTGLGLSIVKGLVEAHRGTIQVQSQTGVGTMIEVSFPKYRKRCFWVGANYDEASVSMDLTSEWSHFKRGSDALSYLQEKWQDTPDLIRVVAPLSDMSTELFIEAIRLKYPNLVIQT